MRLGGGDVELPDGSDAAARQQLQRQVFGRGSAEGHHRLSPWHSAGVAVPQGRSLNLVAWPLQAEHQRRYARENCGPQREQNGDVARHDDVHGQDDNRATLRSCFNLELILHYALA